MSWQDLYLYWIYFVIGYFLYSNSIYLLLLISSFFSIRKIVLKKPLIDSLHSRLTKLAPPITIIAPAFNEEFSIKESSESFLFLNYPQHEVIIVNDGSTDGTFEVLERNFQLQPARRFYDSSLSKTKIRGVYHSLLFPNLLVVDKENGGKADSINVGIGYSSHELFCTVDSDSVLDDNALLSVVLPFIEEPDRMVASGGTVRPVNGSEVRFGRVSKSKLSKNPLVLLQVVEYLRAFLFGRVGWNLINATMIISGAFGIFKKSAVREVGGYHENTVGEDLELVVRLRRYYAELDEPVLISFMPDPVCWTEVPSDLISLGRQRHRWQRGLAETLMSNLGMLFNPRYKTIGLIAFPYFFIVELLGPIIEFIAYLSVIGGFILGFLSWEFFVLFLLVDIGFGVLMSIGAVLIEESAYHKYPRLKDLLFLIGIAPLEHFGFRQWNSVWRFLGLLGYFFGEKNWGLKKRHGFES